MAANDNSPAIEKCEEHARKLARRGMSDSPEDRRQRTIDAVVEIQEKRLGSVPPVILALRVAPRVPLAGSPGWWRLTQERIGASPRVLILRAASFADALEQARGIFRTNRNVLGEKLRSALGEPM